jgi:hypothetical protein
VPIDYSLKERAEELLDLFEKRFNNIKENPEFGFLIRPLDEGNAVKLARELFGDGEHKAVGIDGTMLQEEALEMLLFYVSAMGYSAPFRVDDGGVTFDLKRLEKEEEFSMSSVIPLWLEDLPNVAVTASGLADVSEIGVEVTFSVMLMAEVWAGIKALENGAKVLFMDRPLSGSYQTLSRDVRRFLKMDRSALKKLYGDELANDVLLLLLLGYKEAPTPERPSYFFHRAVAELMKGPISPYELARRLGYEGEKRMKRMMEKLNRLNERRDIFELSLNRISLKEKVVNGFRERAYRAATDFVNRVFSGKGHPFRVGDDWVTTPEINSMNFILLQRLIELSYERKALLIGIAKDTNASEYVRSVVPLLIDRGSVKPSIKPRIRHDRIYLTMVSSGNPEVTKPAWRSIGYDACFSTMIKDEVRDVIRAARRMVSRERLFIRGYFQLRASKHSLYRSPVFFYDRPYMRTFDEDNLVEIEFEEEGRKVRSKVYLEEKGSPLDNLILYILKGSDNPEIFEAYGHNMLLYMADKAVKADGELAKGLLRGLVSLKLTPLARRERLYSVIRRFREARGEMESRRKERSSYS